MHNKDSPIPPENAIKVSYPEEIQTTKSDRYFIVARTKGGLIPGISNGHEAFYAYLGKEWATTDFEWIVVENFGM